MFESNITETFAVSERETMRMKLFVEVYLKTLHLGDVKAADIAKSAVSEFDKTFPLDNANQRCVVD